MAKILVVDDDVDILAALKRILKKRGFEVHTHATGLHIAEMVEDIDPDVILLDINLPGKKGTDVCKEIKRLYEKPVLLISAHAEAKESIKETGAEGFIEKPFEINTLVKNIEKTIEQNFLFPDSGR